MHTESLLKSLRHGSVETWNHIRKTKAVDFSELREESVSDKSLHAIDFSGLQIANCQFHNVSFGPANLTKTRLESVEFTQAQFAETDFSNCKMQNVTFDSCKFTSVTAADLVLSGVKFLNCQIKQLSLQRALLDNMTTINGGNWSRAAFHACTFRGIVFDNTHISSSTFQESLIDGLEARPSVQLGGTEFKSVRLGGRQAFDRANLKGTKWTECTIPSSRFVNANLNRAEFHHCDLSNSHFDRADLRNAKFTSSRLCRCSMIGIKVNKGTSFEEVDVEACRIENFTLRSLNEFGKLSEGDRMTMEIVDGVAILRSAYSGFWHWIHLFALVLFLLPYAWFIGEQWTRAKFLPSSSQGTVTLLEAVARFVVNGGRDWQEGFFPNYFAIFLFTFALIYNVIRAVLLGKTKQLELKQEAIGLPVRFSLIGGWGRVYSTGRILFWCNLAVVLAHTVRFLMQRVPAS